MRIPVVAAVADAQLGMADAFDRFRRAYPTFDATSALDELRRREFGCLDAQGQTYLDFTGGGLYAESQVREHLALLAGGVFGNPHSVNPTSEAASALVERARAAILAFFGASAEEYAVIFTPNASGALRLVGEAYPFADGGRLLLTADNHSSVNGIREFARARGATVSYAPLVPPELRIDERELADRLDRAHRTRGNLFAYPAQSNFSGVQHPLRWIAAARARGWDVLLDAAAFAPTNRLDLGRWQPDFVSVSFYKIFGYPTGVGCLLARKGALRRLRRPWFAGGTVGLVSVRGEGRHRLLPEAAGFEDGTVNYLSVPAVEIGLRLVDAVGMATIHERVRCLTGWLLEELAALRHDDGAPLVAIHGPTGLRERGGTIAFTVLDPTGRAHDARDVEVLAARAGISLRTGCFCNPGAGEAAHAIPEATMARCFDGDGPASFGRLVDLMRQTRPGGTAGAVRVSVGAVTTFADVYRFVSFARGFVNASGDTVVSLGGTGTLRPDFGARGATNPSGWATS